MHSGTGPWLHSATSLCLAPQQEFLQRSPEPGRSRRCWQAEAVQAVARLQLYLRHLHTAQILESGVDNLDQTTNDLRAHPAKCRLRSDDSKEGGRRTKRALVTPDVSTEGHPIIGQAEQRPSHSLCMPQPEHAIQSRRKPPKSLGIPRQSCG